MLHMTDCCRRASTIAVLNDFFTMTIIRLVIGTLLCLQVAIASRILMMTLGGTKSHKVPFLALGRGLASRGHSVTLVSAFPPSSDSPVEEISPLGLVLYVRNFTNWDLLGPRLRGEQAVTVADAVRYAYQVCDVFYSAQETRALLSRKLDLLILDGAFPECLLGLVSHFGVPFVYLNTIAFYTGQLSLAGNPTPFSITPYMDYQHSDRMTFWERSKNAMFHLIAQGTLTMTTKFLIEPVIRKHFGDGIPSVFSIGKDVSLILQHGHHSVTYPRPYFPGIVEVACIHCRPPKPLSEDLESFVSGCTTKGFVYVSFGTSIKTSQMPEVLRLMFIQVFSELPYRVVWKYEDDKESMPDLPQNVRLDRWLPQQDLLGHPQILAFVTHGGIHSILEAVYHAVPLVTLPVFCDQAANTHKAARDGYAISLSIRDLSAETLLAAINKVINDKRYKESVVKRSELLRDQPQPPLDLALYWVDYVLRHRGAFHLQSPARDLSLTQYYMLDVIAVFAVGLYYSMLVGQLIIGKIVRRWKPVKIKQK